MTNVCIAGASHLGLITVFEVLQQAGMQLASPFHGDESIDMAQWHDQVLASAQQDGAVLQPVSSPGRHWSKLALDIFAANSGAQVWGWADRRSTWLLNFWQNFEPRTRFILVCGSPQHMLAAAITAAQDGVAVGALIDAWRSEHEQLLRFHHRNPECSVLVDATECANFPRKLVELCVNKWQLPLALESDPKSRKEEAEPLTLFLSQQLCRTHADALALQHEISATLARFGPPGGGGASGPEPFDPDDVVAQWHSMRMLAVTGPTVDPSAHTEPDALRDYVADLVAQHAQSVEASGQKLDEASRENELLLSALWQLQQELQAEQDTSLGRAEALDTATTNLQQAERNNEWLALQLRQVQEELQRYFAQHKLVQGQLKSAGARWHRMLQRTPGYCDFDGLEVVTATTGERPVVNWRVRNFEVAGRSLPTLDFATVIEVAGTAVVLQRGHGEVRPLLRWPASCVDRDDVRFVLGSTFEGNPESMETLSDLSTSDWDFLRVLAQTMSHSLAAPLVLPMPDGLDPVALRVGLQQFEEGLASFPARLRYDRVALKREQVNPDYEHLWLRLENLSFGESRWADFEFRLSCADVRPKHFGQCPKLEFPEHSSEAPFEAWFVEATDDFGPKLELRFKLPDSMDLAVWSRVSQRDRAFLSAVLERLPAMLLTLQIAGVALHRSWDDWSRMALAMQGISAQRTALPVAGAMRTVLALAGKIRHAIVVPRRVKPVGGMHEAAGTQSPRSP